jgi:hypothetical protein
VSLPPGVDLARDDVRGDPRAAEERGAALMATSAHAVIEGVEANGARYVASRATAIVDAWGRLPVERRDAVVADLADAAARAAERVVRDLRELLATDPARQPHTPLEIVRTLRREPASVLAALGVPPIVRDAFEERALPDDHYGLAPRSLVDLGDQELGAMLLAWGVGKATVLRARAAAAESEQMSQMVVDNLSIADRGTGTEPSRLGTITAGMRRAIDGVRARLHRGPTGTE